ncbi:MAG: family 16 glycosylhydrolase [Hamadaea sp.]|uniref:family 16 glycosylhydrolase n=1 Tax=Hamadaea sp. TaxID=2024425 RepID=UPI0017D05513|nr:family 16 glycosylhydrolase [Hamadaea sp.]NUT18821.1 family 16 glycosylhydrolase [Hamadaea sp.]
MNAKTDVRRRTALAAALSLLTSGLVVAMTGAQPLQAAGVQPNPLDKPGWILDRHDEFDGSLDTGLWVTNYLESRTPEWRSRARYGFRDNALVLRIDNDQPTYYADNPMKVSSIQTGQRTGLHQTSPFDHSIPTVMKYAPQYGYFEIRAKSSARTGIHTAFWTVGKQDTSTQRAEIDVVEHAPGVHGLQSFYYNLHKWSDPNLPEAGNTVSVGFDMTADFHIYALEWNPTQIKLYVDNVLKDTINASPAYPSVFLLGIYENAGWTGTVDPNATQPKEFVVDYFRAYKRADTGGVVSGATYKIRNVATGRYLDSEASGVMTVAPASSYDDQDWVVTQDPSGAWTIRNVRTGRYYLDTDGANNAVLWNSGEVIADSLWGLEPATGGYRLNNSRSDRDYMYATAGGELKWNTGSTDSTTVWALERK